MELKKYSMTLTVKYLFVCFSLLNLTLLSQTIITYSVLSTGYDRVNHVFYPTPNNMTPANFDPYWFINRTDQLSYTPPTFSPIPNTTVTYNNILAYIIYPGAMSNSGVNARYINKIGSNSSSTRLYMTYRTYFTLPSPLPPNKEYSIVLKARADDVVYGVGMNGADISSGTSFYNDGSGNFTGSAYSGSPAQLIIPYGSSSFAQGLNYIEITSADVGLSVTGVCAEVILYEKTLTCEDW